MARSETKGWGFGWSEPEYHSSVENFKRRRAMPAAPLDRESKLFFEKILNVKQEHDMVFVPKPRVKGR